MSQAPVNQPDTDKLYARLFNEAEAGGYHLNFDIDFTRELVKGLIINERRYSYPSCPCRLASGVKQEDLDIICPCDYRDPDLTDYGTCYCGLYVSTAVIKSKKQVGSIPERRLPPDKRMQPEAGKERSGAVTLSYPVWRCKVCGYLCARDEPPEVCPVCRAKKERFERFM